jgi:hypothetical protein
MASFSHSQKHHAAPVGSEEMAAGIIESVVMKLGLYKGPELATLPAAVQEILPLLFRHALAVAQEQAPEWCIHCVVRHSETLCKAASSVNETIRYVYDLDLGREQTIVPSSYEYRDGQFIIQIAMRSASGALLESAWKAWPQGFSDLFRCGHQEHCGVYHTYQIIESSITRPPDEGGEAKRL